MNFVLRITLIALFTASSAFAVEWAGSASATYHASSTLHDWSGVAKASAFRAGVELKGETPTRLRARIEFPVKGIGSENEKRDANMLVAMKADEHPLVVGEFDAALPKGFLEGGEAELPVRISLLGRPRQVACKASNWRLVDGEASFDVEFPVSLKEAGIEIPTVMFFIRVADQVTVRTHVTLAAH